MMSMIYISEEDLTNGSELSNSASIEYAGYYYSTIRELSHYSDVLRKTSQGARIIVGADGPYKEPLYTKPQDPSLCPELTEQGKQQAQLVMDKFKKDMSNAVKEAMDVFYTDVVIHIESDSWLNYQNAIIHALYSYTAISKEDHYAKAEVRSAIYAGAKEEIDKDLNQDLVEKIKSLEDQIEMIHRQRSLL